MQADDTACGFYSKAGFILTDKDRLKDVIPVRGSQYDNSKWMEWDAGYEWRIIKRETEPIMPLVPVKAE